MNPSRSRRSCNFFAHFLTLRQKLTRGRLAKGLAAVFVTGAIGALGATWHEAPAPSGTVQQARSVPVEVIPVAPATSWPRVRTFTGVIRARRTADLSFPRLERLIELLVDEGDKVATGQVLARLDTTELDAQRREVQAQLEAAVAELHELENGPREQTIDAARAEVAELESMLQLAEARQQRKSQLVEKRVVSVEDFDTSRFTEAASRARLLAARHRLAELEAGTRAEQLAAQRAELRRLEGTLARLEAQREDSELNAPFAGTIGRRYLDEGAVPQPGTPVLRLVETGVLESVIGVPNERMDAFTSQCRVTLSVGDRLLDAELAAVLPELDDATRTRKLVFRLNESANDLAPGQLVRLEVAEPVEQDGFWVPVSTLVRSGRGLWSVYRLSESEDGLGWVSERCDVEILLSEADRALVRGTLQSGDQVIASGTHRIVNGQSVQVSSDLGD